MQGASVVAERFEIESVAGAGAMGTVYKALDRRTGKAVALKLLHTASRDGALRFAREADLLAGLRHPGIVGHIAHGHENGAMFLAMEWLEGESLATRLTRGTLPVADVVTLASTVAEVLATVHARGVVHRDIKPGNLFLVGGHVRGVRLIDFGVAHLVDPVHMRTRTGMMLGTPGYVSPEQARGAKKIDGRADVFSLGCVVYKCLTGTHAFPGKSIVEVLTKVQMQEAPRASPARPDVPRELDDLLARMLAKSPGARPDGAAIQEALLGLGTLEIERGAALSGPGAARSIGPDELRLLTLVVVAPPSSLEPDTLVDTPVEGPSTRMVRRALAPFGARCEAMADGTLIATLTGRRSAVDQAVQAARAALVLSAMQPEREVFVVTGRGMFASGLPHGEALDRAVAMLRASPLPGGSGRGAIVLDELTGELLAGRFVVRDDGAARVLAGEHPPLSAVRELFGGPSPCVGRDREIERLAAILEASARDGAPRAALVTGPAGGGKSRLLHALLSSNHLAGPARRVWVARGEGGADLSVLAAIVRAAASIDEGEPAELWEGRVAAALAGRVDPGAIERVARALGSLAETADGADVTGEVRAAHDDGGALVDALATLFAAISATSPVVVVIDDVHAADATSMRVLLTAAGVARGAVTVIGAARAEAAGLFVGADGAPAIEILALPVLSPRASANLVREALGDVDEAEVRAIVGLSGGRPLELEERIRGAAHGSREPAPALLATAHCELEPLGPEARQVLRAASVFGPSFRKSGVAALLGGSPRAPRADRWLATLVERGVLVRRAGAPGGDDVELAFQSELTRVAAYATLTEADRAIAHRLAEDWVTRESTREVAAPRAPPPLPSRGPSMRALLHAAERRLEEHDAAGAIAKAEEGVLAGAEGPILALFRAIEAQAHGLSGDPAEAMRYGLEAARLGDRRAAGWHAAMAVVGVASAAIGNLERLVSIADELCESPDRVSLSPSEAASTARLCIALCRAGRVASASLLLARAGAPAGAPGEMPPIAGWSHLARAHVAKPTSGGAPRDGLERDARAAADASRAPLLEAQALATLADIRAAAGRTDDALEAATRAMAIVDAQGGLGEGEAHVRLSHAKALHAAGHVREASAAMAAARERLLREAEKIHDAAWREAYLMKLEDHAQTLALASAWVDFARR